MMSRVCSYPFAGFCLFELILCTKPLHLAKLKMSGRTSSGVSPSGFRGASVTIFAELTGQDDMICDMCQVFCLLCLFCFDSKLASGFDNCPHEVTLGS